MNDYYFRIIKCAGTFHIEYAYKESAGEEDAWEEHTSLSGRTMTWGEYKDAEVYLSLLKKGSGCGDRLVAFSDAT